MDSNVSSDNFDQPRPGNLLVLLYDVNIDSQLLLYRQLITILYNNIIIYIIDSLNERLPLLNGKTAYCTVLCFEIKKK